MLRKGTQHGQALETILFLSRNKYLNCEFLFSRECLAIMYGSSECQGKCFVYQIQPFNIYCLFTTIFCCYNYILNLISGEYKNKGVYLVFFLGNETCMCILWRR